MTDTKLTCSPGRHHREADGGFGQSTEEDHRPRGAARESSGVAGCGRAIRHCCEVQGGREGGESFTGGAGLGKDCD